MYDIHEVRDDFYFLRYTGSSWPTASNIFLIKDKNGLTLIDTGLNKKEVFKGLSNCLHQLGYDVSDIHTVVLTHGHTDHIAGLNIIREFCSPRVFLSKKCIPEATDLWTQEDAILPRHVREIAPRLRGYDILCEFNSSCGEWKLKDLPLLPIEDGDEIRIGNYSFQAIHSPGHDVGLMVFFEPETNLLLSTDLLRSTIPGNALPWYSSTGGGVTAYLKSLDRAENLHIDKAFPSHGTLPGDIKKSISETRNVILDREARIMNSLKNTPKTCEQLDLVLYTALTLKFCPWFSSTTEAHLQHLKGRGLVKKNGLEYRLTSC
jgi:glyoxylase-like metal-dependent hydrolase (beta-lactamase superfamily II)